MPGEHALIERVARAIACPRVLDIGVGAGRTTPALVSIASTYVGVDLSRAMIERCLARFGRSSTVDFRVADARNLPFASDSFDLVLFSYLGIDDLVDRRDRRRAIVEMVRVASPGGWVALSTHNLNALAYHFSARRRLAELSLRQPARIPHVLAHGLKAIGGKILNPSLRQLSRLESVLVRDTVHRGRILKTWYTRPDAQVRELETLGLAVECVLDDGGRPTPREALASSAAVVPYYLCRKVERQ